MKVVKESIWKGDCLKLMQQIPDKSVDMILCDLPYGTTACKWDIIIPFELLWEQYNRIIKDNGAIVLTSSQPFTSSLIMSNIKMFRYCWVWQKSRFANQMLAKKQPLKIHEDICVFYKKFGAYSPQDLIRVNKKTRQGSKITDNIGGGKRKTEYFQEFTNYPKSIQQFRSEGRPKHPTQKPVALFEYLIKTYTNKGDIVLDNCAGSGTTGIACQNLNRRFILIEKDEDSNGHSLGYMKIIDRRLKENRKKLK